MRTMLKSKIHRARVTDANLHYEGSVTLDPVLMEAADLLPYEQVQLLDIDNGARLTTYVIEGDRGSGQVVVNGAAAHLIHRGDTIIVLGDTLGMVVLGYETTIPVTMEDMLHHVKAIVRGTQRALVVADMPFMSYQTGPE